MGQLSLPASKGPVKPGIIPAKALPGVLGDVKSRARWIHKWDYR